MDKSKNFENKVIIVDGFSGAGKTILPPIIDAFRNTLLPSFYYELEWLCSLWQSSQISDQVFISMIRNCCDLKIYNQLLGREVNSRFHDLSSFWKSSSRFEIIKRLFSKNDKSLYTSKNSDNKILCLTITQAFKTPTIFQKSLGKRLFFIEFVRDPMNMFLQNCILFETVIKGDTRKDFTLRKFDKLTNNLIPAYLEDAKFINKKYSSTEEYIVSMFDYLLDEWEKMYKKASYSNNFLLLPMEQFLIHPEIYMEKISNFIGQDWKESKILKALKIQYLPRKTLTKFEAVPIYKRYGFKKINANNLVDERKLYIEYLFKEKNINKNILKKLNNLSKKYFEWLSSINKFHEDFNNLKKYIDNDNL